VSAPYFVDATTTIHFGDSIEKLKLLADNSIDACITDPPYGLAELPVKKVAGALTEWIAGDRSFIPGGRGFMGAAWDRFVPPPALWDEVFRVLKPGGYLASFAGARTQDLMGMSIRLAGFTIKDQLQWLRADSFNKSKHVLKAGYEPIILAQKPLDGTIAQNVARWGTGSIDAEGSRTPYRNEADEAESKGKNQHGKYGTVHGGNAVYGDYSAGGVRSDYDAPGRWPTNLALDEATAQQLDSLNPSSKSRAGTPGRTGEAGNGWRTSVGGQEHNDEGGPSRFYPVFTEDAVPFHYAGRATVKERPVVGDVSHTTVKPLSVMDWLIRLLTPAGGTVLDPFAGSGTTGEAALLAGYRSILVEANEPYLPLILERLRRSAISGAA
jgi:DNA modification methylase